MSDTTVTYALDGAAFTDGTTLSGTWTAEYDPSGHIVAITNSSFVASGEGGTTDFTAAYPLSYANPTAGDDYEITFPAHTGGSYTGLYVDWTSEDPGSLNAGNQTPYTSIRIEGINGPIALADGGTITESVACFVRGTLIDTPSGLVPVERLTPGDHVTLAGGGAAPLTWIGRRRLQPSLAADPSLVQPIAVLPGALDGCLPRRTLRLSPEHALFLDGALFPAGLLVNGRTIIRLDVETVEYVHLELDHHDIILAEGAPAETYLDTGNRSIFANAPLVGRDAEAQDPCAPMHLDGPPLERVRVRLEAIADQLELVAA